MGAAQPRAENHAPVPERRLLPCDSWHVSFLTGGLSSGCPCEITHAARSHAIKWATKKGSHLMTGCEGYNF